MQSSALARGGALDAAGPSVGAKRAASGNGQADGRAKKQQKLTDGSPAERGNGIGKPKFRRMLRRFIYELTNSASSQIILLSILPELWLASAIALLGGRATSKLLLLLGSKSLSSQTIQNTHQMQYSTQQNKGQGQVWLETHLCQSG